MAKQRIGIYIESYVSGGLERFLEDLQNNLNRDVYEVCFFYAGDHAFPARLRSKGHNDLSFIWVPTATLWRLGFNEPRNSATRFFKRYLMKTEKVWRYFFFNYNVSRCRKAFQRHPVDVLHVVNGGYPAAMSCQAALVAAAKEKIPVRLLSLHGIPLKRQAGILDQWIDECVAQSSPRVIACCRAVADSFAQYRQFPQKQVHVIYNGIQISPALSSDVLARYRQELGLGHPLVGNLSALEDYKGHRFLIEAVDLLRNRLPSLQCLIVGDGPQKDSLQEMVRQKRLQDRVIFVGGYTHDNAALMGLMDLFIHPSLKDAFPYVILEAMALGKPIIATKTGGIPEQLLDHESGLLIPPGSAEQLANTIAQLLEDPVMARRLGEGAKRRLEEQFTLSTMMRQFEQQYGRNDHG